MRLTIARVDKVAALRAWLAEILGTKAVTIRIVATSRPERDIECRMDNLGRSVKRVSIKARVLSKMELRKWQAQREVQDEIESSVLRNTDSM